MVLLPSARARGWVKVKLAKHLFEHRYDYRTEWLRFTDTLGRAGRRRAAARRPHRQGLRRHRRCPGRPAAGARRPAARSPPRPRGTGRARNPRAERARDSDATSGRRSSAAGGSSSSKRFARGWAIAEDRRSPCRNGCSTTSACGPEFRSIHHDRLVGIVLLAAPEYRRPLDWEDFDLLRTAGRQAASSLAEAHGQEALSNAQRFEEFNRRFAFILHDIKNLVSQLSLLSRNAERHADNAEFRADMVATLKSSVGKMNELLARLSPQAPAAGPARRAAAAAPDPVRGDRGQARDHEVALARRRRPVGGGRRRRRSSRRSAI